MPEESGPERSLTPATVLMVEDDETTRCLYRAMLEQAGFTVLAAEDFNQAVELLDESIDVALLDIMLQGRSGLDILKHIHLHLPSCPVIMISAYADKGNAIEALNAGAVGYLQKPVDPRELFHTVRHWVDFYKMQRESRQHQHDRTICDMLREDGAGFRQLVEQMPAAIVVHDRSGNILYLNPAAAQMLHAVDAVSLVGRNILEFVQPGSLTAVKGLGPEIEAGRSCRLDELQLLRCDGSSLLTGMQALPLRYGQQQAVQVMLSDIAGSRWQEERLREQLQRSELILQATQDGYWEVSTDGRLVRVNDTYCRMSGYSREELLGMRIGDLEASEDSAEIIEHIARVLQTGHDCFETRHRCKGGRLLDMEISVSLIEQGEESFFAAFLRDIGERKRTEQQLQHTMHSLGERMKELRCLYGLSKLSGLIGSVDDYLRQAVQTLPPGWQYPDATCARIVYSGREFRTENFYTSPWCLSSPIIVQGEDTGMVEVCYLSEMPEADHGPFLTEEVELIEAIAGHLGRTLLQMEIERQLRKSEDRFRSAFDSAVAGMALVGPDGSFRQVNGSLCNMIGYTEEELLGKTFQEITHPDDLATDMAFIEQLSAGKIPHYQMEKRYLHKLGQIVWVRIKVSIVRNAVGDGQHFVVQIEDITKRRQAEESARQHREKLERFNRLAVGRELVMIELKKEINGLLAELGREEKYVIHEPKGSA